VFIATGLGLCVLFFSIFDWSGFSVAIAALVSAAMFWKARAQRHVFGKAVGIGAVMRRTLGGSAVEAARFDRSQLLSSVELTSTHRRTARQSAIGGVILVLLGAGGMFGSWLGRVVDLAVSDTSDSTTYAPVVEFTPQYASSAIRFRHSVASSHPSWRVGQEVGVLSDPRDPSNAIIDQGWWTTAFLMIPGAIGVLVVILGLSSLYTARRRARTDGPN